MKKIILSLIAVSFILTSCKDDIAPTLQLKGGNTIEHSLNEPWSDPGFTADDDKDGDLTSSVDVSGKVDVDEVGDYTLTYSVTDEAGNKSDVYQRTVQVRNDADHLEGFYSVTANPIYGTSTGTPTNGNQGTDEIIISNTINNRFFFDAFPVYGELDGDEIVIPQQDGENNDEWLGSGMIKTSGQFDIEFINLLQNGSSVRYDLEYQKN